MFLSSLLRGLLLSILLSFLTPAWGFQRLVIADFSSGVNEEGVPSGWQLKERKGKADFSIIQDAGIHALRLRCEDASFAFQKLVTVNPRHFPVFSWKWKVTKLPEGGDVRRSRTDDQAAQLFLAFSNKRIISYIWDTTAPQGLIKDAWAPLFLTIKAVVVRSGQTQARQWITETRNAYNDYKRLFGQEPPSIAGVRIQINSQHTETSGESFFADVVFKRK